MVFDDCAFVMGIEGSIVFAKKTHKRTMVILSLPLLNATPVKQESRMDKKGFCKAILTKETCFGQERLTDYSQETLTKQICDLDSSLFAIKT